MSGISWFILVLLVIAILSLLFLKDKVDWIGGLQLKLASLMSPKGETLITKLKTATEKEKEKAEELQKILDAKRELAKARATNTKLRKEIAGISEASINSETKPTFLKGRMR